MSPGGGNNPKNTARLASHKDWLGSMASKFLHFHLDARDANNLNLTGKKFRIRAVDDGAGGTILAFPMPGLGSVVEIDSEWTMDVSATGIDMATFIGGRVDGIAEEANRDYLYWGFVDDNNVFAGFGITRKPYSTFTSAGTGNKGTSFVITVTNPYQFTLGARVVVRNNRGTGPQYEWNWGTITAITTTQLTVLLDNNDYGTNLTTTGGGDGGVVAQWDKFRPWVVTSTGQTIFGRGDSPFHYSLLGEVYTDQNTVPYRVDEPHRIVSLNRFPVEAQTVSSAGIVSAFLGRILPLWANDVDLRLIFGSGNLASFIDIFSPIPDQFRFRPQPSSAPQEAMVTAFVLHKNCRLPYEISFTGGVSNTAYIITFGYWVHGGMRR